MTAISQAFMRYKISRSYRIFSGEYHEYIKNVLNLKKNTEKQIHFIQKFLKNCNFFYLNCLQ